MTIKLQTYDNYKPSGVEWLGDIPEHWEVKKVTHIFNKIGSGTTPTAGTPKYYDNGQINWLQTGDLNDGLIEDTNKKITSKAITDFSTLKQYQKESIVIAMYGATIGKLGYLNIETTTNQACCVLGNPNNYLSKFGFYSFMNAKTSIISMSYGGGQPNISQDLVKSLRLVVPPLEEQTAIAHFLDDKTVKINQAIAIKQKQIELLKERRQILIHKAVTRGLNDTVKLKDSGVEWIGEIPEHWKLSPLRHLGKTQNGISKGGESFGTGFPFVSYGDVYKDIKLPELVNGLVESTIEDRKQYSVLEGDILFTRTSETVEEIGFSSTCLQTIEDATFAGFLIRFRPQKNRLHKEFSKYYFSSKTHRAFFVKEMNLVIRASLSQDLLKRMPVLLPPLSEQEEIGNYLNNATTKIATAILLKEQEIDKLKEYKMSLIDGVVTGKVKVF